MNRTIRELARLERKSVTELVTELPELGMHKKATSEEQVLTELRMMSAQLGDLTARAVKASAGARWFARMSTTYSQEMTQYLAEMAKNTDMRIDKEVMKQQMAQFEKNSKSFEEHYLQDPWDKL